MKMTLSIQAIGTILTALQYAQSHKTEIPKTILNRMAKQEKLFSAILENA